MAQVMRGILFPSSNLIFNVQTHSPDEVKTTATGTLNNRVTATLSLPNDRNTPNNTADDIPDTIVPYTAPTTTTIAPTTTRRGGGL